MLGLQMQSLLLNVDRLCAGDILLSRPRERDSWFIAKLGGSRFSHAEIVVKSAEGVPIVYEATIDLSSRNELVGLVRKKLLPEYLYGPTTVSKSGGTPIRAKDISNYVEFEVLRWHDSLHPDFKKFQVALEGICAPLFLKPYADLNAIARLTRFPKLAKLLGRLTGWIPHHVIPGLFCSQLVAMVYKEGKFPLSKLPPEDVTPRHLSQLAEAGSPLKIVPRKTLLFSPATEYELKHDWRKENEELNQRATDVAETIRGSETIWDWFRNRWH